MQEKRYKNWSEVKYKHICLKKNKRILAGCFNLELNPDCPNQVQAGNAGKVTTKAELLISHQITYFLYSSNPMNHQGFTNTLVNIAV